jgi:beta-lactamase regulating signal transducer with metallopeptidase domain
MKLLELMMDACPFAASWLWRASWQAAVVVVVVLVAQRVFRRWLTPRWRHALWFLVLARLIIPVGPSSSASIFNWVGINRVGVIWTAKGQATGEVPGNISISHAIHDRHFISTESAGFADRETIDPNPMPSDGPSVDLARSTSDFLAIAALGICLLGFMTIVSWVSLANLRFWRRVRATSVAIDPKLQRAYVECCGEIGLRLSRAPGLLVTSAVSSPALGGIFRPRILAPEHLPTALNHRQIRLVLLHELAHFTCGDLWLNWIWTLVYALHWFNPVLWLARSRCAADRELARDAMVLQRAGAESAHDYGNALIRLVELSSGGVRNPGIVAMAQANARIQERIVMISRFGNRSIWRNAPGIALMLLTGCVALTGPKSAANSSPITSSTTAPSAITMPDAIVVDEGKTATSAPGESSKILVTRVYDVRELLVDSRANKAAADAVEHPEQKLLRIAKKIESVIAFDTWKDNNPKAYGQITVFKNSLIVTAVADVHAQIGRLLRQVSATTAPGATTVDDGKTAASAPGDSSKNLVTRVYDVRDLLIDPKARMPVADSIERQLQDLKKKIETVVEPNSWKVNDPEGSGQIDIYNNSLIVTATAADPQTAKAAVQEKIAQLLLQMREARAIQITVETRFFETASSQSKLEQLIRSKLNPQDGKPADTFALLPADGLNELLRAMSQDKDSSIVHAPRVILQNGQGAQMFDHTSMPYVAKVEKKPSGNDFIYTPVMGEAVDGVDLDIRRVVASADHKFATVAFKAGVTRFSGFTHVTDPADPKIKYEVPMLQVRSIDSVITLSNDQLLLISLGPIAPPAADKQAPATRPGGVAADEHAMNRAYLVMSAHVIVNREIEAKPSPAATSASRP